MRCTFFYSSPTSSRPEEPHQASGWHTMIEFNPNNLEADTPWGKDSSFEAIAEGTVPCTVSMIAEGGRNLKQERRLVATGNETRRSALRRCQYNKTVSQTLVSCQTPHIFKVRGRQLSRTFYKTVESRITMYSYRGLGLAALSPSDPPAPGIASPNIRLSYPTMTYGTSVYHCSARTWQNLHG